MHIHIATLGNAPQPVLKAVNAIDGIDEVYLIHTIGKYQDVVDSVTSTLENLKIKVFSVPIDFLDFNEIVSKIHDIFLRKYEKGVMFSMNITGGTNLMAAAVCSSAFFIGAKIYYVSWSEGAPIKDQVIEIPTPRTPNIQGLGAETRTLLNDILELVLEKENKIRVSELTEIVSKKHNKKEDRANIWHHLRKLESEALIEITKGYHYTVVEVRDGLEYNKQKVDKRQSVVSMTQQGLLVARWINNGK